MNECQHMRSLVTILYAGDCKIRPTDTGSVNRMFGLRIPAQKATGPLRWLKTNPRVPWSPPAPSLPPRGHSTRLPVLL